MIRPFEVLIDVIGIPFEREREQKINCDERYLFAQILTDVVISES